MKRLSLLVLLSFLIPAGYASAQQCPCDTAELSNGLSGNEIIEIVCPGGSLGPDSSFFRSEVSFFVGLDSFPSTNYRIAINNSGEAICEIDTDPISPVTLDISILEYQSCEVRLTEGCGLPAPTANIPTLSEWGLMAMTGILAIAGALALRRRKAAA